MSTTSSSFRGYSAILQVKARMQPLAQWLKAFRPGCNVLTLRQRDFDLIKRYPDAASAQNIFINDKGIPYWEGFELRVDDRAPDTESPEQRVTP